MSGSFEIEDLSNNKSLIYGRGPVSEFMDYPLTLTSFTKGRGKISFIYDGYEKCHNSEEVLINKGYVLKSEILNQDKDLHVMEEFLNQDVTTTTTKVTRYTFDLRA